MKGLLIFGAALAVLAVGLGIWVATPQGGGSLASEDDAANINKANQDDTVSDRDDGVVYMRKRQFEPKTTRALVRTSVTFTNRDDVTHGVDFEDKRLKDRSEIEPGASYAVEMPAEGRFPYHCPIHPEMKGTIVVSKG